MRFARIWNAASRKRPSRMTPSWPSLQTRQRYQGSDKLFVTKKVGAEYGKSTEEAPKTLSVPGSGQSCKRSPSKFSLYHDPKSALIRILASFSAPHGIRQK